MADNWRIELFGGLRLRRGDQTLPDLSNRKAEALIACLAFHRDRGIPREVLAEWLWPGDDPEATRGRLRQALSEVRALLDSAVLADRVSVRLDPNAVGTDVAEFEAALRRAALASDPAERATILTGAVALYAGELLFGRYEDWITVERERLAETCIAALGQIAGALAEAGDTDEAIRWAWRAVRADPTREPSYCALMRLCRTAGRTSDGLRAYDELRRALRAEFPDLGVEPSPEAQDLARALRTREAVAALPPISEPPTDAEPVGGIAPHSPFYVVRSTDARFAAAIARQDSIVLVQGPRQVGKTSLLARGLQQARNAGARVVLTDFQKLAGAQMESAESLLRTLAEAMADQLDLAAAPDAAWDPRRGWNVNFERYVRREILGKAPGPVVWGMDEVDRLFSHAYSAEVFGLFRSWHNARALDPAAPWGRLTLVLAHAQEARLFITDPNQSPFNVGTRLALDDFTRDQVAALNRRYGSPLRTEAELTRLFEMVGGHPYLVHHGLYAMARQQRLLEDLLDRFSEHLRALLVMIEGDPDLAEAVRRVLRGAGCPNPEIFYRLRAAGVLAGESARDARLRCALYQIYLERHLL